jgi:hypothetical protein
MAKRFVWPVALLVLVLGCDVAPAGKSLADLQSLYSKVEIGMTQAQVEEAGGKPTKTTEDERGTVMTFSESGLGNSFVDVILKDGSVTSVTFNDRSSSSQNIQTKGAEE